ncbi:MAG: thioredoxin [Flavobacteriia bacterium]|nr:MAG: thioredoxin [Flavobacteriia bacterium]
MKKISILLLAVITLLSCKQEPPKDYVTLSGKITHMKDPKLNILGNHFHKTIDVNEDGTFKDTLKVTDGFHGFRNGNQQSFIYLKNGYDLTLNFDADDFPGSVEFSGNGSGTNQYLVEKLDFIEKQDLNNIKNLFYLDKPEFDKKIAFIDTKMQELLDNAKDLDTAFIKMEEKQNKQNIDYFKANYETEHQRIAQLAPGKPSPKFNYPDISGKNVSLDDLKGKYVYVDVWATWCAPCKREIPSLIKLNEEYKGKDIVFVSLSIDKKEDKGKWEEMVKTKGLKGIQLFADNNWKSDFVTAYGITGIPRFILIDKKGNILDADAPRPSNPKLKELFNSLDI